jgi:hypothetical protein
LGKIVEAIESFEKGLNILLELEMETGYHHPWIEDLEQMVENLKGTGQ